MLKQMIMFIIVIIYLLTICNGFSSKLNKVTSKSNTNSMLHMALGLGSVTKMVFKKNIYIY